MIVVILISFVVLVNVFAPVVSQMFGGRIDRDTLLWRWGHRGGGLYVRGLLSKSSAFPSHADFLETAEKFERDNRGFWLGLARARLVDIETAFDSGKTSEWMSIGWDDAESGICRASSFRNHGYNMGWNNRMVALHSSGWRASDSQEKLYQRMRSQYFDGISDGTSGAFYDHGKKGQ